MKPRWIIYSDYVYHDGTVSSTRRTSLRRFSRRGTAHLCERMTNVDFVYRYERNPEKPPMSEGARAAIVLCSVFAAAFGSLCGVFATQHHWFQAAVCAACVAIYAAILIRTVKEARHGSRSAAGDRHDPGTSTSPTPPTAASSTGQGTSPSIIAAYGVRMGQLNAAIGRASAAMMIGTPTAPARPTPMSLNTYYNHLLGTPNETYADPSKLPEREDDTPILASKTALLIWQLGAPCGPALQSAFTQRPYDLTTDHASCAAVRDHAVPQASCSCGYYAVRDRDRLAGWHHQGAVLLDVELFGKVIVYEHGYRAERQRILSVGIGGCWYCQTEPSHVCAQAPTPWDTQSETTPLLPMCAEHLPLARANVVYTTDAIAGVLGAPVRYEPLMTPPDPYPMGYAS